MRVTAFTKYGREAASTRQRLLQYLPALNAAGIAVEHHPLLNDQYVRALATGARFSKVDIARAYAKRLATLLRGRQSDCIYVYAELFPYLPAGFERLAFRPGKPVVYDFDDAFSVNYDTLRGLRGRILNGKLEALVAGAAVCLCGNDNLLAYARRRNGNAILMPTVVDTSVYVPQPKPKSAPLTIGWIGSPSTWRYVRPLLPLLRRLGKEGVRFLAIGAGRDARSDEFANSEFRDWSEEAEVAAVQAMDIGIMPLPDEPWTRGKSGYKLIQYMACGLPVVASPVGVNSTIVEEGKEGLLASDLDEWEQYLRRLIDDRGLRQALGTAGRDKVVQTYSLQSQTPRLIEALRSVVR